MNMHADTAENIPETAVRVFNDNVEVHDPIVSKRLYNRLEQYVGNQMLEKSGQNMRFLRKKIQRDSGNRALQIDLEEEAQYFKEAANWVSSLTSLGNGAVLSDHLRLIFAGECEGKDILRHTNSCLLRHFDETARHQDVMALTDAGEAVLEVILYKDLKALVDLELEVVAAQNKKQQASASGNKGRERFIRELGRYLDVEARYLQEQKPELTKVTADDFTPL